MRGHLVSHLSLELKPATLSCKDTSCYIHAMAYWEQFVASRTPEAIASQLLHDVSELDNGNMPSHLAMHTPRPSSSAALEIAAFLTPSPDLHPDLKRFVYEKLRTRLRKAIEEGQGSREAPLPADGYLTVGDFTETLPIEKEDAKYHKKLPPGDHKPTVQDMHTALHVLRYLNLNVGEHSTALDQVITLIQTQFDSQLIRSPKDNNPAETPDLDPNTEISLRWTSAVSQYHSARPPSRLRVCYICRYLLTFPHALYRSLCQPCGAFNAASSALSLPPSLSIPGYTALVTGARVNLGYHVVLRLLRCGAHVLATTRYPHDAALRYAAEADSANWSSRLRVIGADFRTARDAFSLVRATKEVLSDWGVERLHVLVNNAAQTLTDSVRKEERAVAREAESAADAEMTGLVFEGTGTRYQARVRGGVTAVAVASLFGSEEEKGMILPAVSVSASVSGEGGEEGEEPLLPTNVKDDGRKEIAPYFKSSWVQTMEEIPYEDVVSAHAVNAFVPLILCRELLPMMGFDSGPGSGTDGTEGTDGAGRTGRTTSADGADKSQNNTTDAPPGNTVKGKPPHGYIINVSSREGLFENRAAHGAKRAMHVHTNMTKAAVNMITQTEAAAAWKTRRVAMNTVDPGYMSAAPEMDHVFGGERPLDWEDGTGRVLWPVAMGEVEKTPIWGRFLKHYGAVDVEGDVVR